MKQNSRNLYDICPKMSEFYVTFARKIFFPKLGECLSPFMIPDLII